MKTTLPLSQPLRGPILPVCLLVSIGMLLYFNSLGGAFQFDDRDLIQKEWIADLKAFGDQVALKDFTNRPVLLFTYALNNTLNPSWVFGFHLLNLLLHLWVTLLIFFILLKTQKWVSPSPPSDRALPFLTALLFAVHPLNTDSVSYISSRSTLLATFFYLLTLYAFLSLFCNRKPAEKPAMPLFLVLVVPFFLYLSLASKLIAVTLPAALALCFFAFICPAAFPAMWQRLTQKKMLYVYAGGMILIAGVFITTAPQFLYAPKDQGLELFGRWPYFWVQLKVIAFYYLKLFAVPFNLNVDPGFPFSSVFTDPQIALALVLLTGLVFTALRFGNLWMRVGTLWFILTLAPTSSLVPLNDLAVEHRMYLPMTLGLCLIAGLILKNSLPLKRHAWAPVILVLLAAGTLDRNRVWIDEASLWADAVQKNPHSPRTHNNLGKAHYENGDLNRALLHFQQSVANIQKHAMMQYNLKDPSRWLKSSDPSPARPTANKILKADFAEPHYNLASVYLDTGQLENAAAEYAAAIRLQPNHHDAYLGLGSVHARLGKPAQAEGFYLKAITAKKAAAGGRDFALARLNLGELYGKSSRFEEAIRQFDLALKSDPSLSLAHYNLGVAYLALGNLDRAEHGLTASLSLDPDFQPALFNLARVLQDKKAWDRSSAQFEKFLQLKGPDARAHYHIGVNHHYMGRMQQARQHLNKALDLNPPPVQREKITRMLQNLS